MMRTNKSIVMRCVVATAFFGSACDPLLEVDRPDIVEESTVDPNRDATTFSRSAFQNLTDAAGDIIVYNAWFTNEARVGDTFPTRNEFGRRFVIDSNGTMNTEVFRPLSQAIAFGEQVRDLLSGVSDAATNVNLARAAFASGYGMIILAEMFCEGVIRVSPPIPTNALLDSATVRLQQVVAIGSANPASATEARNLANAARVGIARALLQQNTAASRAAAVTEAAAVPAGFSFSLEYIDDPTNRGRLGNSVFFWNFSRESLVVGPEWRAIRDAGDTRISYDNAGRVAQDGELQFFRQQKHPNFGSPIRLASKLEADYIAAEASGDPVLQLNLVNARRAVGGQGLFAGTPAAIFAELMRQRAIDFWLEGKRMGDFRRNPGAVPFILQPGNNYYKPALGPVGSQTCIPIPLAEKDNNPKWPDT